MGKAKAAGSQKEISQKEDSCGTNDNEETIEGPAAKKRKVDLKHKNGTGSLAAYGASLKIPPKKPKSEDEEEEEDDYEEEDELPPTPTPQLEEEKPKKDPSESSAYSIGFVDGNCAERIKDASLCRKRKQTERLVIGEPTPQPKRNNPVVVTNGNGTKFGSIPYIVQKINSALSAELETIHKVIFGRKASPLAKLKQNLKSFSGFSFDSASKEYKKKRDELTKLEKPDREFVCEWLGLNKLGNKEGVVESILEFLMAPSANHVNIVATTKERKSVSPTKEPKSSSVASSPAKKKSPAKPKASPKKKAAVAPKFSKPKQAAKKSPAKKSPKNSAAKASPKKSNARKTSPKKKAAAKPVFKAKAKKNAKKAVTQISEEDEEKDNENVEEMDVSSDTSERKDEEQENVMEERADSAGTKSKKKPSFKKQAKKSKNNAFASQTDGVEEDQDVVSTTSSTQ